MCLPLQKNFRIEKKITASVKDAAMRSINNLHVIATIVGH